MPKEHDSSLVLESNGYVMGVVCELDSIRISETVAVATPTGGVTLSHTHLSHTLTFFVGWFNPVS